MVPTTVGANKMAAHAEIFFTSSLCSRPTSDSLRVSMACARLASESCRISSFCCCVTRVACTVNAFSSSTRNESARSVTRSTWSSTSRNERCSSTSTSYLSDPRSSPSSMPFSGPVARWKSMTSPSS
ncbi:hypothetical protein D9M68_899070 [compost metagenome]